MPDSLEDYDRFKVIVRHAVGAGLLAPVMAVTLVYHLRLERWGPAASMAGSVAIMVMDWCGVFILGQLREGATLRRPSRCVGPSIVLYAVMRAILLAVMAGAGMSGRPFATLAAYSAGATGFFAWVTWRRLGRVEAERDRVGFPVSGVDAAPTCLAEAAEAAACVGSAAPSPCALEGHVGRRDSHGRAARATL